jgi:hypothetical protein
MMPAFEDKADMPRGSEAFRPDANDPKRTSGGSRRWQLPANGGKAAFL